MTKWAPIGIAWVVCVLAAFAVGRATAAAAPTVAADVDRSQEVGELRDRVDELEEALRTSKLRRERRADESEPETAQSSAENLGGETTRGAKAEGEPPDVFSFEGLEDASSVSAAFMEFTRAQLARGPKGYDAILASLNLVWERRDLIEELTQDEATSVRELYPWIRMLVYEEDAVLDMSEYVFRTMAEAPAKYEQTVDDNILELWTEGLGVVIPGAADEQRMERLRGYARAIIDTPEEQQPKAIQRNRSEIERLLERAWSPVLTPEQALAELQAGTLSPRALVRALQTLPPETWEQIDATAVIAPAVRQGERRVIRALEAIPAGALDRDRLDVAAAEGLVSGDLHPSLAFVYLHTTRRRTWADARPLFDRLSTLTNGWQRVAADAIRRLPEEMRPDKAYVESLLSSGTVQDGIAKQLRKQYDLGE